jgi:hypothetical protein
MPRTFSLPLFIASYLLTLAAAPAPAAGDAPTSSTATQPAPTITPEEARAGFIPLFDGHSLAGWEGDTKVWRAEGGLLIGEAAGLPYNDYLATTRQFSAFDLRLQIRLVGAKGNSGIQFRTQREPNSHDVIGYQADYAPGHWSALFYELEGDKTRKLGGRTDKDASSFMKFDDWTDYEIIAQGDRITLKTNGKVTLEYTETRPNIPHSGILAVQVHSKDAMQVQFRNMRIRELENEGQH